MESQNYWERALSSRAPSTQQKYKQYFKKFCTFTGKTPNELIAQRRKELQVEDPREKRGSECLLKAFMVQLQNQEYSPATRQLIFAAIKSFYESNEYPLRTKRGDYPKGKSMGSRGITKPLIKQIIEAPKFMKDVAKMKALIFFLKDTGLRVSDVRKLNYGHVKDGLEKNLDFIPLQIRTQKSGIIAKTFIGPEAVESLKEYLKQRKKGTRKLKPETITDDTPLFRTNRQGKVRRISRVGLSGLIGFQCKKTGTTKLSAHSFRKFLQTNLDAAGISPNFIDQILGHSLPGTRGVYSLPSDEILLENYRSAYDSHLRVYPDKTEVEERVSKLESEVQERNTVIAELSTNGVHKKDELEQLKSQVETLTRIVQSVWEGKAKPVQSQQFPEAAVFNFSDTELTKVFGLSPEKIRKVKEQLKKIRKQNKP